MIHSKNDTHKKPDLWTILIVLVAILLLSCVIIFVTKGKTTVSGTFPESKKTGSLVCTKDNVSYPYVEAPNADSARTGSIRVVGTYNEAGIVEKIALDYSVVFENSDSAVIGEAVMHGEFGKRLTEKELPYNELNNKFSIVGKKVVMSLFASKEKIKTDNYQYLLLDSKLGDKLLLAVFEQNYKRQEFKCLSTDQE